MILGLPGAICVEGCPVEAPHPLDALSAEAWADLLDKRGTEAARIGRYELAGELIAAARVIRWLDERAEY